MSAYVVSPDVISPDVISRIVFALQSPSGAYSHHLRTLLTALPKSVAARCAAGELQLLGQALHNLNVRAVNERYGENTKPDHFELSCQPCSLMRAFADLGCLLYQCAEGSVPSTKLFKALRHLEGRWACDLVTSSDAYKAVRS